MVSVGNCQLQTVQVMGLDQEVQERYRVRAAGNGNQTRAWRQRKGGDMSAKGVEQAHTLKLQRRPVDGPLTTRDIGHSSNSVDSRHGPEEDAWGSSTV
jgi:hypothetical protein